MKLTIILVLATSYFFFKGFKRPYFFTLGFLWLALLYPQGFEPTLFADFSFSLVFAAASVVGFLLTGPTLPRLNTTFLTLICFAIWVSLTTCVAVLPAIAYEKWTWAIQSILIALILPVFFRTRVEIEMALIVVFCSFLPHIAVAGTKTLLGGGGYQTLALLMQENSWLGESSTLANVSIASIPFAFYILRHSIASQRIPWRPVASVAYPLLVGAAMVGTAARSGLIALGAYCIAGTKGFLRVALLGGAAFVMFGPGSQYLPSYWTDRMETISDYENEGSAAARLQAWNWTLGYVVAHPLGGGFEIWQTNGLKIDDNGKPSGRAFHSIYFEMLGEQGIPGAILYAIIMGSTLIGLFRYSRDRRLDGSDAWIRHMATALLGGLLAFLAGGAFIGVAFSPIGYLFAGFFMCLLQARQHVQLNAEVISNSPESDALITAQAVTE